ncbi:TIGR02530 family flagellar biosynthesis protein [Alkalicoccobacillus murimartini]|uniref:Flagellar operon protein n=1 Tax=Alkalicoccobacillus murimartini TaxID=171685 RepID=A0ABT9YH15_9BACI|nr:TIGR02530 family flagellar biosynthesis protein [Alkalicoccobacillus murimartini]MDQ0206339.1 flagellar operon protein [Alkalicoccobacillus murimartini]
MIDPSMHLKATAVSPQVHQSRRAHSPSKQSFSQILHEERQQLTISKHANERLATRGIQLDQAQWNTISEKLKEAGKKGITDALVVTKDAALVANTKSQTIITALNRQEAESHIFTNINGTILLDS